MQKAAQKNQDGPMPEQKRFCVYHISKGQVPCFLVFFLAHTEMAGTGIGTMIGFRTNG